jgi:hypothetical protein
VETVFPRDNNLLITYTWTKSTMEEHALRLKVRAANVIDDTQYVLSNGVPYARYEIATIERKFGDMDIALTQLKPGITGEMEVILCSKVVVYNDTRIYCD